MKRYLGGFGPSSRAEIADWAGLKPTDLEPALKKLKLRRFRAEDGEELLDLPRAPLPDPDTPAPVRFLPVWDAILLVHARRTGVLPEEHRSKVFNVKTPQSMPTFMVDGLRGGVVDVREGARAGRALRPGLRARCERRSTRRPSAWPRCIRRAAPALQRARDGLRRPSVIAVGARSGVRTARRLRRHPGWITVLEAELLRLREAALGVCHVAELAGEAELAEGGHGLAAVASGDAPGLRWRARGPPPGPRPARRSERRRHGHKRVAGPEGETAWRARTASTSARRLRSTPLARRRGGTSSVGATSACTSTSSGREPSIEHRTTEPGSRVASETKRAEASSPSARPGRASRRARPRWWSRSGS